MPRKIRDYPNINGVIECPLEANDLTLDAQGGVRLILSVSGVNGTADDGAPRAVAESGMPIPPGAARTPSPPRVGRPPSGPPMFPAVGGEPPVADSAETSVWQFDYVRLSLAGRTSEF
jgi:hypothetical protein